MNTPTAKQDDPYPVRFSVDYPDRPLNRTTTASTWRACYFAGGRRHYGHRNRLDQPQPKLTNTYTLEVVNDGYDDMRGGNNICGVMKYS